LGLEKKEVDKKERPSVGGSTRTITQGKDFIWGNVIRRKVRKGRLPAEAPGELRSGGEKPEELLT